MSSTTEPPPGMTLRPARVEDGPVIGAYHHECWMQGYRGLLPDEVLDGLRAEDRIGSWTTALGEGTRPLTVVAIVDDRPIGHVYVEDDTIHNVYVDPEWWGRGIGPVLLAEGERLLGEEGVVDAVLWTIVGNDRAVHVYEKAGWQRDGTVEDHPHPLGMVITEQRLVKQIGPTA
jgi:GNAT superfamily N-acetyltransferase